MSLDPVAFRQFRQDGSLTYLIHDGQAREAILVDPHCALLDTYRDYLFDHGLKLRYAIDTRVHPDDPSCSHFLRQQFGCEIAMSEHTRSDRPTLRLRDGQKLEAGRIALTVVATPGLAPDAIALRGEGFVFTGDTLLIGSVGKPASEGAQGAALHASLHERLLALPDATVVFPGHDHSQRAFTTIEAERRLNPLLKLSAAELEARLRAELAATNGAAGEFAKYNLTASPEDRPLPGPGGSRPGRAAIDGDPIAGIGVEKYAAKLKEHAPGSHFLDVRERDEFGKGRMAGTRNIPLAELGFHLKEFEPTSRIYLSCFSGVRSLLAARTLDYLGFKNIVNVTGGIKAWEGAGLPVTR